MKKKAWLIDAAIGLVLSLLVAGSYVLSLPWLENVELMSFDMRSKFRQTLDPSSEIALIAIDEFSIKQYGRRWPWPRTRVAEMLDKLAAAQPKVVGLNILFSEPEENQGLLEVKSLGQKFQALLDTKQVVPKKGVDFAPEFDSAAVRLDSDSRLAASLKGVPNVLPMFFESVPGARPEELPAAIAGSALSQQVSQGAVETAPFEGKPVFPVIAFAETALGVGHVNLETEIDGVVRRETPAWKYGDAYYPSYAVQLVMAYRGLKPQDAIVVPGVELQLGEYRAPLDAENRMFVSFVGPERTFKAYSFHDVINDKVDVSNFKDKIVLIGLTAAGVGTLVNTPVGPGFSSLEVVANVVDNILHRRFLTRPPWAAQAELGLLGLVALFIMLGLPRVKAGTGAVASLVLLVAMLGAGTHFFMQGHWLKVTYPCVLLGGGYLVIVSRRFFATEKGKELVEASQIETNKMLGLSFQGQGMYDMAFEKFRLCPLDDNMKDTLYSLSLDFERKRQYGKAVAVMEHIAAKDPKFKDIAEKMKVLKAAADGAVFGGVGQTKKEGTVVITGGATKPTLGRYEIEKELGRGAMGIVYLGKDPKINRMVAIKTMVLEEGSDANAAKEVRERFFREAESAGTLNHPNIVRIFDAGEENDVCYIAMELLDGRDLTDCAAKDKLLPPEKALEYVATVADALDYAHQQGIVHRDIKPANIMLLKDGTVRVADFGIARITASSKTATGTVMGTPSYMSPEQVAGKKVDGRSDLFSLGVALFELLTGEKPFKGGEGIGTLLFQIANDPHPDPLSVSPKLPAGVKGVIDKVLAKKPEERYQRGGELAKDIRTVLAGGAIAAAPAAAPAPAPAPAPVAQAPAPAPAVEAPVPVAAAPAPAPAPEPAPEPAAVPAPSPVAEVPDPRQTMPMTPAESARPAFDPRQTMPMTPAAPAAAPADAAPSKSPDEVLANLEATLKLSPAQLASVAAAPVVAAPAPAPAPAAEKTLKLSAAEIAAMTQPTAPPKLEIVSNMEAAAPAPPPAAEKTLKLSAAEIAAMTQPVAPAAPAGGELRIELGARPGTGAGGDAALPPPPSPLQPSSDSDKTVVLAPKTAEPAADKTVVLPPPGQGQGQS